MDLFKKYGGAVLLGFGVVGLVIALGFAFWLLTKLAPPGIGSLPLIAIGGVVVLILSYRSANAASEDFAKQLLVLLGTLMTAITSFYLGAGTATSAVKAGSEAGASAGPVPTLSGIKPPSHSPSTGGAVLHLEISGANLNSITRVKIVKAGAQPIVATNVKSSPTGIVCELDVSNAIAGTWDVEVDDGGSKSAKLPGALTIT
jgi:hypothetical protein